MRQWMAGGWRTGLVAAAAAAAAMIVLGWLTFGVQASAHPSHLPLAIAVPAGPSEQALTPVARQIAAQGGDAVDWQIVNPERAAELLDDKEIYGYLTLAPAPDRRGVTASGTVSGALLPTATQAAEQVLRATAAAVTRLAGPSAGAAPDAVIQTVHPVSLAARILPLAATTLLWIGALAGNMLVLFGARQASRRRQLEARIVLLWSFAALGPALVFAFANIWDSGIEWNWAAVFFLSLVATTFVAMQGAVLRLLGIAGAPVLALLYLMAPSVVGQPPELLNAGYRALLWSWTPFRFAAEPFRSLLFLDTTPTDVGVGCLVLGVLAVVTLIVLMVPGRPRPPAVSRSVSAQRNGAPALLIPGVALELIARELEHGNGRSPNLVTAAARLAPLAGSTDTERARAAAVDVLRPAARRALERALKEMS